ncbi:MAG: inositol monophosphatase, partial [Acetobacteraceae bacterium]|nr:inositol monophosphatase [Acetobacteraceae bacterium]
GGSRFCVSLARIEDRQPLIGVIVAPALQETFAACRHQGATLNEQPIRAAGTTDPGHSIIEVGWSLRRSNQDFLSLCKRLFDIGATLRHGGSGALGLADVAAGRMDAYAELHINLWDVAAGLVILAEAGASISDFMHGEGLVAGNPILACTQGLWDTLSALVL